MEYDAMIFGNGLTLNLLSQLKAYIPLEKHYLLAFDTFMASFINEQLPADLDHRIFFALYTQNSIANQKYYAEMKSIFRTYYHYCDGNIEKYFGLAEFQRNNSFNYSAVKTYMPFFYNIWFCILDRMLIETHQRKRIHKFYTSVKNSLSPNASIYTTNFDLLADPFLSPKHLHGRFVQDLRTFGDCVWQREETEFTFKYLWGWNGLGKGIAIYEKQHNLGAKQLFDWDFFLNDQPITHVLIYGLSFQCSGFVTNDLIKAMPQYKQPQVGAFVDEHILLRLKGLQNKHTNLKVTFAYYDECILEHYHQVADVYDLKYTNFIPSAELLFHI